MRPTILTVHLVPILTLNSSQSDSYSSIRIALDNNKGMFLPAPEPLAPWEPARDEMDSHLPNCVVMHLRSSLAQGLQDCVRGGKRHPC